MPKCELCGRRFQMITGSHLLMIHGITADQYRAKFPHAAALRSDEVGRKISNSLREKWRRAKEQAQRGE